MRPSLDSLVRLRANGVCEYCRCPEAESELPFAIDHVILRKHRGATAPENLAFACPSCNSHKGADLTGIDPEGGTTVRLFGPRTDRWGDHFRWDGPRIVPLTPVGRVTEYVLALNAPAQLSTRKALLASGWLLRVEL